MAFGSIQHPFVTKCLGKWRVKGNLKKWKYNWHAILCWFQVYRIVIWHLYTLWYDHHAKSSFHLLLFKVIILLTILPILYITFSWIIYFVTGTLCLLFPFTYFTHTPSPLFSGNHQFSVSVRLFLFSLFIYYLFFRLLM